jgi:hypothetical protein
MSERLEIRIIGEKLLATSPRLAFARGSPRVALLSAQIVSSEARWLA